MVVLDTSVINDHLRQKGAGETVLMKAARRIARGQLVLSVLSVQELYAGRSTVDHAKEALLVATIAPLKILPYDYATVRLAGEIIRDAPRPVTFTDAGIAATAIRNDAELCTLDKKDFAGIPRVKLYDPS